MKNSEAAGHSITFDQLRKTMIVTKWGFWSLQTHAAYATELARAEATASRQGGPLAYLIDNSRFPVQSAEVSAALAMQVRTRVAEAVPTAVIVRGALAKMQATRVGDADHVEVFLDREAAQNWLSIATSERAGLRDQ